MAIEAAGFNYTDALAELQDMVQSSVAPTLTTAELNRLLRYAAITDEDGNEPDAWPYWTGTTAYVLNYRVVPSTRNGYVYIVTTAGTSSGSAPSWPTTVGNTVTDGTVAWTCEATAPWTPTYGIAGLHKAALAGYERKYSKLLAGENFSADGASFDPAARRRDIMAMIAHYKSKAGSVGSFRMRGRTSRIEDWDETTALVAN